MKITSSWKKSTYHFSFSVHETGPCPDTMTDKITVIETAIFSSIKKPVWSGRIRVRFNEFGIFPFPEDLNSVSVPDSVKKMLLVELRRYIKPQNNFL